MAARKLTGNSGKAISPPLQRVPWSSLNLPETFRSIPETFRPGSLPETRGQRSLVNTFPFNQKELDHPQEQVHEKGIILEDNEVVEKVDVDEGSHQEERQAPVSSVLGLESRDSRQGEDDLEVGFAAVAAADPGDDGKRCIDKVQMVEETVYDDVMQCDHSYDRRCHTTYTTNYESQQEEECEENFRKTCFIEYQKTARNETVNVCREPLVKNCEGPGEEICKTVYESECWTKQEAHEVEDDVVECKTEVETKCEDETSGYTTNTKCKEWPKEVCSVSKKPVTKYTPITGCTKEPREICGFSDGCTLVPGEPECYDKTQTIVSDAPKEQCNLEPQRTCSHVTKLVPKLEPKEECTDVPKEVCTRSRTNPRKVKKPVVKKWCYVPTEESGLA